MDNKNSILSEMIRLEKSLIKMEYKMRRLFEESQGNPDQDTVIEYNRIMQVDYANLEILMKKYGE